MSLNRLFDSPHKTRFFLTASISFFLLLIGTRFFILPDSVGSANQYYLTILSIFDSFTTGYFVTILIGLVVYYFSPSREDERKLEQCHARDIGKRFEVALRKANQWKFKGNLGRYLRSVILPTFASRQGVFSIDAIFIDPSNDEICEKFSDYKNNNHLNDPSPSPWKKEDVQSEIIATLAVCCWFVKYPTISINIYFADFFSPMRMDSSSDTTIVAVENSREPGLIMRDDHFMNQWFLNDFTIAKLQSKKITLTKIEKPSLKEIEVDDLICMCSNLCIGAVSSNILKKSLKLAQENKNPYA